jgi:hypothetical protein
MKPYMTRIPLLILPLALLSLGACSKSIDVKTKLQKDEAVQADDPVVIGQERIGKVREIVYEDGEPVAILRLDDNPLTRESLRVGIVRIPAEGEVQLTADKVKADAEPLQPGSYIPSQGNLTTLLTQFSSMATIIAIAVGIVVVLMAIFFVKRLFNIGAAVVTLVLAGFTAWFVTPFAAPFVTKAYEAMPAQEQAAEPQPASAAPANGSASAALNTVHTEVKKLTVTRPDPDVTAFVGLLIISFLFWSAITGKVFSYFKRL